MHFSLTFSLFFVRCSIVTLGSVFFYLLSQAFTSNSRYFKREPKNSGLGFSPSISYFPLFLGIMGLRIWAPRLLLADRWGSGLRFFLSIFYKNSYISGLFKKQLEKQLAVLKALNVMRISMLMSMFWFYFLCLLEF